MVVVAISPHQKPSPLPARHAVGVPTFDHPAPYLPLSEPQTEFTNGL
jgi:hypothetical protein